MKVNKEQKGDLKILLIKQKVRREPIENVQKPTWGKLPLVTEVPNWRGKVFKRFTGWQLKFTKTPKNIKYRFVSNETVTANYFGALYVIENLINFFGDALTFFKQNSGNSQS